MVAAGESLLRHRLLKRSETKLLEYDVFNRQDLLSFFAISPLRIIIPVGPVFPIYVRFYDITYSIQGTRLTVVCESVRER